MVKIVIFVNDLMFNNFITLLQIIIKLIKNMMAFLANILFMNLMLIINDLFMFIFIKVLFVILFIIFI